MVNREQEEKMIEETKMLAELFLKTNASDIELAKMTGISSSTVGRRLTNEKNILKAFGEDGNKIFAEIKEKRQENLLKGKALGGQTTLLNHVYNKDEYGKFRGSTKIRLDVIYHSIESQYKFIVHTALTFRLHLDTLSQLFQIDEQELLKNMISIVPGAYDAITYLIYHDAKDQMSARSEFLAYYRELLNAIRLKDNDEKKRLINIVSDSKVALFKKTHEFGDKIRDEDILAILKYQMKYALTADTVAANFGINRANYQKRVYAILENNEELKREYEYLADYNQSKYKKAKHYG